MSSPTPRFRVWCLPRSWGPSTITPVIRSRSEKSWYSVCSTRIPSFTRTFSPRSGRSLSVAASSRRYVNARTRSLGSIRLWRCQRSSAFWTWSWIAPSFGSSWRTRIGLGTGGRYFSVSSFVLLCVQGETLWVISPTCTCGVDGHDHPDGVVSCGPEIDDGLCEPGGTRAPGARGHEVVGQAAGGAAVIFGVAETPGLCVMTLL